MNVVIQKIKLIVWDLDDTFWNGTLSENGEDTVTPVEDHIELVKKLSRRGIVHSICSKNNREAACRKLEEMNIRDYFVFCSIDWSPKGERLKKLVSDMSLRPENVLFIDDNPSNIGEAEFMIPFIMTAGPEIIRILRENAGRIGKDDPDMARLAQYKVLEEKKKDAAVYSSNIEFLKHSDIKISISNEILPQKERLLELIQRTNQLNFTKKRIAMEELETLAGDEEAVCGYVQAKDHYGDYGIIGFFAVKNEELIHFLFSCRVMGMGIEQYIYVWLKCPKLNIVPEVSGNVSNEKPLPEYIQKVDNIRTVRAWKDKKYDVSVLIKGPCDLEVMASYIKASDGKIVTEFNFVDGKGNQADFYNHTVNMLNSYYFSQSQVKSVCGRYSFLSPSAFDTTMFSRPYDVICISVLMDATLSVYRSEDNHSMISYGLYTKPLTEQKYWDDYAANNVMTAHGSFSREELERFSREYTHVPYSARDIVENLKKIFRLVWSKCNKNTQFVIVLLPELPFDASKAPLKEDFAGKEKIHKRINDEIKKEFCGDGRICLLDVNRYIHSQADYFDNINHYSKLVYYHMALELIGYIKGTGLADVKAKSKSFALWKDFKHRIRQRMLWLETRK